MKTLRELKDFSKTLVLDRFFDKNIVGEKISEFLGFSVVFEESTYTSFDHCLILNLDLGDKDLYFDVWYLLDRTEQLFITEIGFDSDHALNVLDDDKKIIGVAQ